MNKPMYQSLPLSFLIIFLFIFSSSAHDKPEDVPSSSSTSQDLKGCFPKVYAFGDSDTDTGNAPLVGTHFQGGNTYNISGKIPTKLVIDFLCLALALPPPPSFLRGLSGNSDSGVNFAVSGSTSFSADIFGKNLTSLFWKGVPENYKTQIDWFNKYLNQAKGTKVNENEGQGNQGKGTEGHGTVEAKGTEGQGKVEAKGTGTEGQGTVEAKGTEGQGKVEAKGTEDQGTVEGKGTEGQGKVEAKGTEDQGTVEGKGTEGQGKVEAKGTEGQGTEDQGTVEGKGTEGQGKVEAKGTEGQGTEGQGNQGQGKGIEGQGTEGQGNQGQGKGIEGQGKGSHKADMANALFWIGQMGVSDYTSAQGSSSVSFRALADSSVKHVTELLTDIIKNGGKYIVVQGLPPVGCFPLYMSASPLNNLDKSGCAATINAAVSAHNQLLQWSLEKYRKMFPNCKIVYADYWKAYLEIMTNPKKYGIEEPFKACCGSGEGQFNFAKNKMCGSSGTSVCNDPSKYVNFDGCHLTEAMHKHLADLFLHQGFCQPSFDELVKSKKGVQTVEKKQ
ncbi:hypothetical protein CASFOL_006621 [Castilleja foliolosa]|uniref:Uncharacterized protein n=1 Tax=Castilleja foliolosa TaxID=1961234 RepID=A0ABD3E6W2_9LAMI